MGVSNEGKGMAKIAVKIIPVRRGGMNFFRAECGVHGVLDTHSTEQGAAVILGRHVSKKHVGDTVKLVKG